MEPEAVLAPPREMLRRRPDFRGSRRAAPNRSGPAMYLAARSIASTARTSQMIGQAVSSGWVRISNDDVVDLYDRVKVGARVTVQ